MPWEGNMSHFYSIHVGLDAPSGVTADLTIYPPSTAPVVPPLEPGKLGVSFSPEDEALVEVCDKIISAVLNIRAEALARMVATA